MTVDSGLGAGPENQAEPETQDAGGEIEALKAQLAQVSSQLSKLQNPVPPKKVYTPEEYKELLEKDPATAFKLAVEDSVEQKFKYYTQAQKKEHLDRKVEQDFPQIKSDKTFQSKVREKVNELIDGGMSPESPALISTAAQLAAIGYKAKESTNSQTTETSTLTSSYGQRPSRTQSSKDTGQLESLFSTFGVSDPEMKKKIAEKMKSKLEGARR